MESIADMETRMAPLLKHPFRLALLIGAACIILQFALAVTGIVPSALIPLLSLGIILPVGYLLSKAQKALVQSKTFTDLVI